MDDRRKRRSSAFRRLVAEAASVSIGAPPFQEMPADRPAGPLGLPESTAGEREEREENPR